MPRMRVHFRKSGYACFISHIDLPILFGRAARRAGLVSEMTQGFSPHPRLALGPPLPVGVVGLCEPAEFWFREWPEDGLARWNRHLPPGIELLEARAADGVSLHKLCAAASYALEFSAAADPRAAEAALRAALMEMDALLGLDAEADSLRLSVRDLERAGPSRFVKILQEQAVVSGWSEVAIARTAVGGWDEDERHVIPLTGESI